MPPVTDQKWVRTLTTPRAELLERMTPEELRHHVHALHALGESMLIHLRKDDLLDDLVHQICSLFSVDIASVALSDGEGRPLVTQSTAGFGDDNGAPPAREEIRLGEGVAGALAIGGEAIIIDDVQQLGSSRPSLKGLASMMVAPLLIEDELIGIIEVGSRRPRHFTEPELYLLEVVSDHVASATRNAGLYDDAQEAIRAARRAERALAESEARHRILSDTAADAIVTIDADSVIVSANPAAARTFGYEAGSLVGRNFTDLIPERFRESHLRGIQRYLSTRVKRLSWRDMELPGLHRTGREILLEVSFAEHVIEGRPLFTGTMRDITNRKRTDRVLSAQYGTTKVLAEARSVEDALPAILRRIGEALAWDAGGFWLWDGAVGVLRPVAFWTAHDIPLEGYTHLSEKLTLEPEQDLPGEVWSAKAPRWVRDIATSRGRPRLDAIGEHGLRSAFAFPVCVSGDCLGVMEFFTRAVLEPDETLLEAMDALGSDIGQFIRRREAEAWIEEQERTQRFFAEISPTLSAAALDYDATLQNLARLAVPRLADWCIVHVRRPDGSIQRMEVAYPQPDKAAVAQRIDAMPIESNPGSPIFQVLETGEARLIPVVDEGLLRQVAPTDEILETVRDLKAVSAMIIPLGGRDRVLGSITLISSTPGRNYDDRDLATAKEFARRAGVALDNARLYREMQEANRAKAEFLATISHELRTPLNAVIGYADLLGMGIAASDPDRAAEYAERIGISARHLAQLIEEVLAFSRLESGREVVSVESVILQDLLNELRIIAEPLAETKGLDLRVETEGPALEIHTDARKVRQILLNVVGNAIKFTDEGEVGVDWEEDGDDFILRISDTGRGISEEHQQRIFDPFWQVEQGTTRTAGGTGLGLTVTRRFIDLLGGTLSIESEVGSGTTLQIRLPKRIEREEPAVFTPSPLAEEP